MKKEYGKEEIEKAKTDLRLIEQLLQNPVWQRLMEMKKKRIEEETQAHFAEDKYDDPVKRDAHFHRICAKIEEAEDLQHDLMQIKAACERISNVSSV
ncbi:MAG: hypothetical protein PHF37_06515 [Phycisphaerae bacterium]|nr:hypothetical protein [Phycisphaerae bacterium]